MKTKVLTIFYIITGILFISLENQTTSLIQFVLKALLIPWLIAILFINLKPFTNRLNTLMFAGLIFSWAGDMALRFSFIPGLVLFLMAHLMYLTSFFKSPGKNVIFANRFWLLIPVILYGALLICYLYGDLGEMRIPVIVYAVIILVMLAGAVNRVEKVNRMSYWLVLAGAVLFVLSDSAIAINMFTWDFNYSGVFIMSTYLTAQYLITTGYIRQYRENCE